MGGDAPLHDTDETKITFNKVRDESVMLVGCPISLFNFISSKKLM